MGSVHVHERTFGIYGRGRKQLGGENHGEKVCVEGDIEKRADDDLQRKRKE